MWGTNTEARKIASKTFPQMRLLLEFDALGTMIYTSQRKAYAFQPSKLHKMVTEIRHIAVLPVATKTKTNLLAAKVIPQCSFAAGISKIPKKSLSKIQTEITNALWYGRPKWRARWLVLALLKKPYRVEPLLQGHTLLFWISCTCSCIAGQFVTVCLDHTSARSVQNFWPDS